MPTKQPQKPEFIPGNCYRREGDGVLMVEIAPGNFVSEAVAASKGIKPRKGGKDGKGKA